MLQFLLTMYLMGVIFVGILFFVSNYRDTYLRNSYRHEPIKTVFAGIILLLLSWVSIAIIVLKNFD